MFKLVIIDDELFALRQLTELFDWNAMGYEVVGAFTNPEDVLRYAREKLIDVLFTDIRLGGILGTALAQEIVTLQPDVRVVFISAFSEFEYARDAIQLNAFEYLLKPITFQSVNSCFLRLREKLNKQREAASNDLMPDVDVIVKRQFFRDILQGLVNTFEDADLRQAETHIQLELHDKNYGAADICYDVSPDTNIFFTHPKYGKDDLYNFLEKLSEEFFPGGMYITELTSGKITAVFAMDSTDNFAKLAERYIALLRQMSGAELRYTVYDGTGIFDVAREYRTQSRIRLRNEELNTRIASHIRSGEAQYAFHILQAADEVYSFAIQELRLFIFGVLNEFISVPAAEEKLARFKEIVGGYTSKRELLQETNLLFDHLARDLSSPAHGEYYIGIAKKYIDDHLVDDISLEDVAAYVSLCPTYFSRYFRRVTGKKYIDYLNSRRIQRAIQLLTDPSVKVSSIYQRVGYRSRSWFSRIFAEETGLTPSDYRIRLMSDVI